MASKQKSPRPLWFVCPIAIDEDTNKPRVAFNNNPPEELEIQPARNRNQLNLDPPRESVGYGFAIVRSNKIEFAFTSKESATEYAKQQASKTPTTAYGVFGCVDVFETTAPSIIEKKFTEGGELVLKTVEKRDDQTVV